MKQSVGVKREGFVASSRVRRKSEGSSGMLPELAENELGACRRIFGSSPEGSLEVRGTHRERSELTEEARWNSPRSNREV